MITIIIIFIIKSTTLNTVQFNSQLAFLREMNILLVLSTCFIIGCTASLADHRTQYDLFKKHHGKIYDDTEDKIRFNIYLETLNNISLHNIKYLNGEVAFYQGINKFADMLESEVRALNGAGGDAVQSGHPYVDNGRVAPQTMDWRKYGVVTPVKDQANCGSCWAFSATGSLEGQYALSTGRLLSFSEQNLIDCSSGFGNHGCLNGMPGRAFNYIKANGGIDTELSYPYVDKVEKCKYEAKNRGTTVRGHVELPAGDENLLRNAVAAIGPISVCLDATKQSFHRYAGGIYDDVLCSNKTFDHCILAVGYGNENGRDFWLLKNSWGPQWGDKGYIKILRNADNLCGIANHASYPLL